MYFLHSPCRRDSEPGKKDTGKKSGLEYRVKSGKRVGSQEPRVSAGREGMGRNRESRNQNGRQKDGNDKYGA